MLDAFTERQMQRFPLGHVVTMPVALNEVQRLGVNPLELIGKHVTLDPGVLNADDQAANERAVLDGSRVLSAYDYASTRFYVITEWDRSVTTLLLASDY